MLHGPTPGCTRLHTALNARSPARDASRRTRGCMFHETSYASSDVATWGVLRACVDAQATALAICAHTSPACGPCAREIKIAPFHTWGYEGRPWTSNDCAQASHTRKNARAHDFSQKRCDAYDRSRPPVNAARTHFAPRDSCRPYIQHVRYASITYNTV
jgi:hypothetical protein